jgi:hypothetical protein
LSRRPARAGRVTSAAAALAVVTLLLTPGRTGTEPSSGTDTRPQRGFAMPTYARDGYASPQAALGLRQMVAVGARWVQFTPTWYQDAPAGSRIGPSAATPTDDGVQAVIAEAHRLGLKVFLKPLLDLLPDGTTYRGTIKPADRAAWFLAYRSFIDHYAELAARHRVDQFAVGTELAGTSGDRDGWLRVVASVRERYDGPLVYAANHDEYRTVRFWDAVDLIGIDAYWPLSSRPTTDVRALQRAWAPIMDDLAAFADRQRRRILFAEAGYPSQRGSTTAPWSWTTSGTPDQAEQAAAYRALLTSVQGRSWWAGVFWWVWNVPAAGTGDDPLGYTPRGKAAERVLRQWWI